MHAQRDQPPAPRRRAPRGISVEAPFHYSHLVRPHVASENRTPVCDSPRCRADERKKRTRSQGRGHVGPGRHESREPASRPPHGAPGLPLPAARCPAPSCVSHKLADYVSSICFIGKETGAPIKAEAPALDVKIARDSPEPRADRPGVVTGARPLHEAVIPSTDEAAPPRGAGQWFGS